MTTTCPSPHVPVQADDTRPAGEITVALGCGSALHTTRQHALRLGPPIATGGEATVYTVEGDPQVVCKIYADNRLTLGRVNKLARMTGRRLKLRGVCWPLSRVHDASGLTRGFIMPRAEGLPLSQTLMQPAEFLRLNPAWTRRDSVRLAVNLLTTFRTLHAEGVLMGDVNENNILMRPNAGVSFVDCDSYQLAGYPCPVGTDAFTPPELQGRAFAKTVRTERHEAFAVAILLFKIMVAGKHPFSHQGGTSLAENIGKGLFPYRFGDAKPSQNLPVGHCRFCWSHLPAYIRAAFTHMFTEPDAGQRLGVDEWLSLFSRHAEELSRPGLTFSGDTRQIGFDLSILPVNYSCWKPEHLKDLPESDYALHMTRASGWIGDHRATGGTGSPACRHDRQPRRRTATVRPQPPTGILSGLLNLIFS